MQHKLLNLENFISAKLSCSVSAKNLTQKDDFELVQVFQDGEENHEIAQLILINRYLPKILREASIIFNFRNKNSWDKEDIIQTGIKAIIVAISSFKRQKIYHQNLNGAVNRVICLNISKYLNKKKTNYDPLVSVSKGEEFKRVFFNYYKTIKKLKKKLKIDTNITISDSVLIKEFNCKEETLKEVQFIHHGTNNQNNENEINLDDEDSNNFIDLLSQKGMIDPSIYQPQNLENYYLENKDYRNIDIYKNILTNKEWKLLELLNKGNDKNYIQKSLSISKQRFSFLIKNISKKIQKTNSCLPN